MIFKRYGCRRDLRDPRDHEFRLKVPALIHTLPPAVDLRPWYPPIMDQGDLGSCTANAITGALRWHIITMGGKPDKPLSRLQLYYDERVIESTVAEDAGAEIRTGIKCVKRNGVAYEELWDYIPKAFKQKPPDLLYKSTQLFGSLQYERLSVSAVALKVALAAGFPVVIGISLFDSFESEEVEKTGIVPMPDIENEGMVGGHAMCAVGYGQKPGCFTVANSWSENWGDGGYCYVPEKYLGSPKFGSDYWVIRNVTTG